MKAPRIRWGMLGGGAKSLIGIVHRIAADMGDDYHLVGGVFSSKTAASAEFARDLELDPRRAYPDVDTLIAGETALPPDQRMRLVTIATPNSLHYDEAVKLVSAGFHVLCEKPVTTSVARESRQAYEVCALSRPRCGPPRPATNGALHEHQLRYGSRPNP